MTRRAKDIDEDYYAILGVEETATAEEISKAYRQQARKYHPDSHGDAVDEEKFKQVARAYEVLSDPSRRAAYDRDRHGARSTYDDGEPDLDPPDIWIDPSVLDFGTVGAGDLPEPLTVHVYNSGGPPTEVLRWETRFGDFWEWKTVRGGVDDTELLQFDFAVDAGADPGRHIATVTLLLGDQAVAELTLLVKILGAAPTTDASVDTSTPFTRTPWRVPAAGAVAGVDRLRLIFWAVLTGSLAAATIVYTVFALRLAATDPRYRSPGVILIGIFWGLCIAVPCVGSARQLLVAMGRAAVPWRRVAGWLGLPVLVAAVAIPIKLGFDANARERQEEAARLGEETQTTQAAIQWTAPVPENWRELAVVNDQVLISTKGSVVALKDGGQRIWSHRFPDGGISECDIRIVGGTDRRVVIVQGKKTHALRASTGEQAWAVPGKGWEVNATDCEAATVANGVLFQIERDGFAQHALAAYSVDTGRLLWRNYAGLREIITVSPVSVRDYLLSGPTVFVAGDKRIVALDRSSGRTVWLSDREWEAALIGADDTRLFISETPEFGGSDLRIVALHASSGRSQWSFPASQNRFPNYLTTAVLPEEGPLVLIGRDGFTSAINRQTGKVARNVRLGQGGPLEPSSEGSRVYVGDTILESKTGELRTFHCEESSLVTGHDTVVIENDTLLCLGSQLTVLSSATGAVRATLTLSNPQTAVIRGQLAFVIHEASDGSNMLVVLDLRKLGP